MVRFVITCTQPYTDPGAGIGGPDSPLVEDYYWLGIDGET